MVFLVFSPLLLKPNSLSGVVRRILAKIHKLSRLGFVLSFSHKEIVAMLRRIARANDPSMGLRQGIRLPVSYGQGTG